MTKAPTLRTATCQFPVSCDMTGNAKLISRFMQKAVNAGAHVIHFPETALPGYERLDFTPSDAKNWQRLEQHTKQIAKLAGQLGLWVVLGSCRSLTGSEKPANCVHVISGTGQIVGTYDKQRLTSAESAWYTPGDSFLVVTINNIKCGFLICYDACFPNLFEIYREKDVQLIFHSCYSISRKPKPVLEELSLAQIRTRAADNRMWISSSNSSARYSFSKACIVRPDGSVHSARKHTASIVLHDFPDTELGWMYDNRKHT